jgi:hypothetical protein
VDETCGRLRHLGARREQLVAEMISHIQQMRDLLECVWPTVLAHREATVPVPDLGRRAPRPARP